MNNREYNILKNYMKGQAHYLSRASNRFIAMDLIDPPIDYLALAASMGVPARRVDRAADIAQAVEAGDRLRPAQPDRGADLGVMQAQTSSGESIGVRSNNIAQNAHSVPKETKLMSMMASSSME